MLAVEPLTSDLGISGHQRQALHLDRSFVAKSPDFRMSPIPGQTYPTTSVTGMPRAVKPFMTATRIWNFAT